MSTKPNYWINKKIRTDPKRNTQLCAVIDIPTIRVEEYVLSASVILMDGNPLHVHSPNPKRTNFSSPQVPAKNRGNLQVTVTIWPPVGRMWKSQVDLNACVAVDNVCILPGGNSSISKMDISVNSGFVVALFCTVQSQFRSLYTLGKPVVPHYPCVISVVETTPTNTMSYTSEILEWSYWNGHKDKITDEKVPGKILGAKKQQKKRKLEECEVELRVDEVIPPNGPAYTSNLVSIWGKAFVGPEWYSKFGLRVFFGSSEGVVQKVNDNFTVMKVVTPPGIPGKVTVTVQAAKSGESHASKKRDEYEFNTAQLLDGYEFLEQVVPQQNYLTVPSDTFFSQWCNNTSSDSSTSQTPSPSSPSTFEDEFVSDNIYDGFDFLYSCYVGDMDHVTAQLDIGFIDIPDDLGATPLIWAVRGNHLDVVEFLLELGANVNLPTKCSEYPLHIAAEFGNVQILSKLIAHGANINCTNEDGETPIFYAANRDHVIDFLISNGADVNIVNKWGEKYTDWKDLSQSTVPDKHVPSPTPISIIASEHFAPKSVASFSLGPQITPSFSPPAPISPNLEAEIAPKASTLPQINDELPETIPEAKSPMFLLDEESRGDDEPQIEADDISDIHFASQSEINDIQYQTETIEHEVQKISVKTAKSTSEPLPTPPSATTLSPLFSPSSSSLSFDMIEPQPSQEEEFSPRLQLRKQNLKQREQKQHFAIPQALPAQKKEKESTRSKACFILLFIIIVFILILAFIAKLK